MNITIMEVEEHLPNTKELVNLAGMGDGGFGRLYLANQIMAYSDAYVPFRSGVLKNNAYVDDGGASIVYPDVYARMMWYGKVMIDPKYHFAGLYDAKTGRWWSRRNVQKVVSNREFDYNGAPQRGKEWTIRAWADHGDAICRTVTVHLGGLK